MIICDTFGGHHQKTPTDCTEINRHKNLNVTNDGEDDEFKEGCVVD